MPRFLHRVGPCLFIATVICYLAGNFFIDHLDKASLKLARSQNKNQQYIDIGTVSHVVILAKNELLQRPNIKVVFDSHASQVFIKNDNLGFSVDAKVADNVLNIVFDMPVKNYRYEQLEPLIISLPLTVNDVGVAGTNTIEVSNNSPTPKAELNIEMLGCEPLIYVNKMAVNRLKLATQSNPSSVNKSCQSLFNLGETVRIDNLDVSMEQGSLEFTADVVPKQALLSLGDTVKISGTGAFMRAAHFTKLEPAP